MDNVIRRELLAVSFGTGLHESRERSIGAIEKAYAEAFPGYEIRRVFTSGMIIRKLKDQCGISVPSVEEALEDAAARKVQSLLLAPTHILDGHENARIRKAADAFRGRFAELAVAKPLLSDERDHEELTAAIIRRTACCDDGHTAICYMGHGTDTDANRSYAVLQKKLRDKGHTSCYIATVEADQTFRDLVVEVKTAGIYDHAVLLPLMVVSGEHAVNDMAGSGENSWRSMFESAGIRTDCIFEGLGEYEDVRRIYVRHAMEALGSR